MDDNIMNVKIRIINGDNNETKLSHEPIVLKIQRMIIINHGRISICFSASAIIITL